MYRVLLERRVEKDLDALDSSLRKRVVGRLLLLERDPRPNGAKKLIGSLRAWRVRIGDWRAIYEIDDKNREVRVYRVKHRSGIY